MGTPRSKHNKGRKPFYKEHGRDTARHFKEPKGPREKLVPTLRNVTPKPILADLPAPELPPEHLGELLRGSRAEISAMVWGLRARVKALCRSRYSRIDPETMDDALAEGALHAIEVSSEVMAEAALSNLEDAVLWAMVRGAKNYIKRTATADRCNTSLSKPLSDSEDGSLTLSSLIQSRRHTPAHLEDHVDAARFSEAASTLDGFQIKVLMGLIEGVSAEEHALEFDKLTPNALRLERARVVSRLREVRRALG